MSGAARKPDFEALLKTLMHEARSRLHSIKANADHLSRATASPSFSPSLKHHADIIVEASYQLALWLDTVDFETNPTFLASQKWEMRNLHGKFHKAVLGLRIKTKPKNIQIELKSEAEVPLFRSLPVIDILPYLVLENAVKYAPPESHVEVIIESFPHGWDVKVSSLGPLLDDDEITRIFDNGYRGRRAKLVTCEGSGRGLALAVAICELHGGTIKVRQGPAKVEINGIPYCEFIVSIQFPNLA